MINIEKACEIVAQIEHTRYIASVGELSDVYVITVLDNNGQTMLDATYTINKKTGECGAYDALMMYKTFKDLKSLEIPKKYQYTL